MLSFAFLPKHVQLQRRALPEERTYDGIVGISAIFGATPTPLKNKSLLVGMSRAHSVIFPTLNFSVSHALLAAASSPQTRTTADEKIIRKQRNVVSGINSCPGQRHCAPRTEKKTCFCVILFFHQLMQRRTFQA